MGVGENDGYFTLLHNILQYDTRDRTNRPLLFRDQISNCTNLFRPEPNHLRRRPPWLSARRVACQHSD